MDEPASHPEQHPQPVQPDPPTRPSGIPWGVIIALLAVSVVLSVVWAQLRPPAEAPPTEPEPVALTPQQAAELQAEVDYFWEVVAEHAPEYAPQQRQCPVDGTQFDTYVRVQDNRFGGVASDLMKIALAPPAQRPAPPVLDRQDFDLLLSTCPRCLASFYDVDLGNLRAGRPPGGLEALKGWDITAAAPPLAGVEADTMVADTRHLLRYLTQRTAGFPHHELGYTALGGAYSSNLSVFLGRDYRIPGAAFYALAAAHFALALENGELDNPEAASIVGMMLGELQRLLGRAEQSAEAFAVARAHGGLDERTLRVLDHLEQLNAAGDSSLDRAPIEGPQEPPVGWYVDQMLPAINGDLAHERGRWADMAGVDEIVAAIFELL